jgi:hypothetical protein
LVVAERWQVRGGTPGTHPSGTAPDQLPGPALEITPQNFYLRTLGCGPGKFGEETTMVKIAKTADRKKVMDTSKSTDCPKCGKATRIVKRVKDRERGIPGGVFISCSACEFYEKL